MKIALCFHGLPRFIEKCYPEIKRYFIDNNEVDIYAHFWWNESHKGKINRLHVKEKNHPDENSIEIFKKLYNPIKIVFEDSPKNIDMSNYAIEGFNNPNIKEDDNYSKIMASFLVYGLYCRFKSINNVINLIDEKNNYDIICIIRPDILLLQNGNLNNEIKNLNLNNIYFPSTKEGGHKHAGELSNKIGDWIFLGNYKNIKSYSDSILKELIEKKNDKKYNRVNIPPCINFYKIRDIINNSEIKETYTPIHNSERLTYWAKLANINLEIFNCSVSVRRFLIEEWENRKYIQENFISPEIYKNLFNKEENKFEENDILPFYTKNIKFIS